MMFEMGFRALSLHLILVLLMACNAFSASRDPWAGSLLGGDPAAGSAVERSNRVRLSPAPKEGQREGKQLLSRGLMTVDRRLRRGDGAGARELLNALSKRFPESATVQLVRGYAMERSGRDAEARVAYRRATELEADNVDALAALGWLQIDRNIDPKGGVRLLKRCLDLDPAHSRALDGMGWFAYKRGNFDQASAHFKAARRADSLASAPLYHLGLVALRKRDLAKALSFFQDVIAKDPSHDRAMVSLGLLYEQLGERNKAVGAFRRALPLLDERGRVSKQVKKTIRRLDPLWQDTKRLKSPVAFPGIPSKWLPKTRSVRRSKVIQPSAESNENRRSAPSQQERVIEPRVPRGLYNLAVGPMARKEESGPKAVFENAVAVSKSMVRRDLLGTHLRLAKLYRERGLMRDAAGEFQTVINLEPLSTEAHEAHSLIAGLGDFADPPPTERIRVYGIIGTAMYRAGDLENAAQQFKKVLLLAPGDSVAHKNLAYIALKEGNSQSAWNHITDALDFNEDNPEALALKGYLLAKRRNFLQAQSAFLRVAALVGEGSKLERYARDMAQKMALFTDLR